MRYIANKNYTQMISEIIEERNHREASEEDIKNAKNTLKSILNSLGMETVLKDERYVQGNRKVLPIHFQILCYVLLTESRSKKDDLVYKIKNQKFHLIEEDEINEFTKKLEREFDKWFDHIEYTGQISDNKISREDEKRKLDEEFLEIERDMIEDQTAEYIETVDEFFSEDEAEYLKLKFDIRIQKNIFVKTVHDNLFYTTQIIQLLDGMDNMISQKSKDILELVDIKKRIVLLNDCDSDLIGTVPIDKIYIDREDETTYDITLKEKATLLELLYGEIQKLLMLMKQTKKTFVEMQKTNIQNKVYWGGDHTDEIGLIWDKLKNMNGQ